MLTRLLALSAVGLFALTLALCGLSLAALAFGPSAAFCVLALAGGKDR